MRASALAGPVKTAIAESHALASLVGALERVDRPRTHLLTVLTYHRVADRADGSVDPALISATPAQFAEQVAFLAANRPVPSLGQLLDVRRGRGRLPPGSVMITFDDAYRDFAEHAWPALRRHDLAVTLFVPTGFPDQARAFWWDRLYDSLRRTDRRDAIETSAGSLSLATEADRSRAFRALRDHLKSRPHAEAMATAERLGAELGASPPASAVLGWDELRRLAAEGVVLAPHSRTHPLLDRLPLGEALAEAVESRRDLEREIGEAPPVFAYPAGGYTGQLAAALGEEGFEIAFTTARGPNDLRRADWLRLRRVNVGGRSTLAVIRAQLLSWSAGRRRPPVVVEP